MPLRAVIRADGDENSDATLLRIGAFAVDGYIFRAEKTPNSA
jgi:hypothetical protein